jgi:UDP-N-acetylmuramate--alanine ligase
MNLKIKVGVLFGGRSVEREVSFNSGRTVCDHLDTDLFEVISIFQQATGELYIIPWSFVRRGKIADFEHRLAAEAQIISWDDLPTLVDFVYIALHGKYGEDGRVQAILELFKIPYLGSKIFGSSIGMNRIVHDQFLRAAGVNVPCGFSLEVSEIVAFDAEKVQQQMRDRSLDFPLVIKPVSEGSSFGVFVVKNMQELQKKLLISAFISGTKGQAVLIEEKLEGWEFNCVLITDLITGEILPLPPTEILLVDGREIFDYEQKYMPGKVNERTPPQCDPAIIKKIQHECARAMRALHFSNMARIDGFVTKDNRVVIIDSNPLSGMGPATLLFRQAVEAGMTHGELINHLIKTDLKTYKITTQKGDDMDDHNKIRVAVLFGGPTAEREVSFDSGRNVAYKLSGKKYAVTPVYVNQDMKLFALDYRLLTHSSTREVEANLENARPLKWSDLKTEFNFVFLGLHGGPGENGTVQGALEMLQIPYNGSGVFTSALCMDKYRSGQFLKQKGFHTPEAILLDRDSWTENIHQITYPCVVKPNDDGCSVLVAVARSSEELTDHLKVIFAEREHALVERLIVGMELTVGVIGNNVVQALVPSETVSQGDILSVEEKFLPGAGENQTPARLSSAVLLFVRQELERIYQALGCKGYARIDCFYQNEQQSPTGEQRVVFLECNSLPALTPATCLYHQAAEQGLRPFDLLDTIIQLGFEEHVIEPVITVEQALARHKE